MNINDLIQRNNELSILNTIAKYLNQETILTNALDYTLKEVVKLFELETGWIWLMDQKNQTYLASSYNLPPVFIDNENLLAGSCWCIKQYLNNDLNAPSNINEIECTRLQNLNSGTAGLKFHASVPLFTSGKKIGILNVVSQDSQQLSKQKLELLYTIGDMLSVAIERNRYLAESKKLGIVEERNRLAREIHDTIAQSLSGIILKIQSAQLLLDQNKKEKIQSTLNDVIDLSQKSLEDVRRSVLDLKPSELIDESIVKVFRQQLISIKKEQGINYTLSVKGLLPQLSKRIESSIYRIGTEALYNISAHSNAKEISFTIICEKRKIILTIEDDGIGFNPDEIIDKRFGIIGMNEQVKLLNGIFEIQSEPNKGTIIHISIPTYESKD